VRAGWLKVAVRASVLLEITRLYCKKVEQAVWGRFIRGLLVPHRTGIGGKMMRLALAGLLALPLIRPAIALDDLSFAFSGVDRKLKRALLSASLMAEAQRDGSINPQDIFAAARADYARFLGALYAQGYYGPSVHILIDGREAAEIPVTDPPDRISEIRVQIEAGQRFRFDAARMKPYAPGTELPPAYRDGQLAYSTAIADAARAGVDGWRNLGHAKAAVTGQDITADHATGRVTSWVLLDAGPRLTFGTLNLSGQERMKAYRIVKIAGYTQGKVFDPETLDKMARRLRQTGIFRSVVVSEADHANPDGSLDINLTVEEEALRRFGFGAEVSSADGVNLSAFWLHRNLFGGGERLRLDGLIKGIEGQDDFAEYEVGARIDRPGTPFTDSSVFAEIKFDRAEVQNVELEGLTFGIGATRVITENLTAEAGLSYNYGSLDIPGFSLDFQALSLPISLKWDRRDDPLDPTEGSYLKVGATPFLGFDFTDSGSRLQADARYYRRFGKDDRVVLAGRLQLGTVLGTSLLNTLPDYLFYSGGGGTVRGHPYQSLGATSALPGGGTIQTGGRSFAALSGEVRATVSDRLGAVAFVDAGYISDSDWFSGTGEWQAGAGLGVRYDTGFGPVRLDVAFPISGSTGDGMQVYVGIGQSF